MNHRWWWLSAVIFIGAIARPVSAQTYLFHPDPAPTAALGQLVGHPVANLPAYRRLDNPADIGLLSAAERRTLQPEVIYRQMFNPNDSQYYLQWNFNSININPAWEIDQSPPLYGGDPRIIVAVLDTGLAFEAYQKAKPMPDFNLTNVWTNPNEVAGDGLDNDHNGLVDDVHGWNFVGNNAYPVDDNGHGSHIASIIAGATNNSIATAGLAFNVTVMPLKVLDTNGQGSTATLTAALDYAVAHGANIVNLSLGGDQNDPIFHDAIKAATAKGIIVVAAAGNSGAAELTYPARYPEALAVGATQYDNTRSPFSNYGSNLDLVAPGGNLEVDQNGDGQPDGIAEQTCDSAECSSFGTYFYVGTSQAAAHVSAVAALLESCWAEPGAVQTILTSTAKDLGPAGWDEQSGAGLLDADAALASSGCAPKATAASSSIAGVASSAANVSLYDGRPYPYPQPIFSWTGPNGASFQVNWFLKDQLLTSTTQQATIFSPTIKTEGEYHLSVSTIDPSGNLSSPSSFTYRFRHAVLVISNQATIRLMSDKLKIFRVIKPKFPGDYYLASGGTPTTDYSNRLLISTSPGHPNVYVTDSQGHRLKSLLPFGKKFTGQISTAILQRLNQPPLIVAAMASGGGKLRWYSDTDQPIATSQLYRNYHGGLALASADLNGDGNDELIVGQIGGGEVRIYNSDQHRLIAFQLLGQSYTGGWSLTVGDTNGDGTPEIIMTPRSGSKWGMVYIVNSQGKKQSSWHLTGWNKNTLLSLQAFDQNGDGVSELAIVAQSGQHKLQIRQSTGRLLKSISLPAGNWNAISRL